MSRAKGVRTAPPHEHSVATKPALRGPSRSGQPPQIAADEPRSTKNSVYIQPRSNWVQSQSVAKGAWAVMPSLPEKLVASPGQASGLGAPLAAATMRPSGTQNTEKP